MNEGQDKLWLWFELSRASFAVLPRVAMHSMPDEWQSKMADLLNEMDAKARANNFEWPPEDCDIEVSLKRNGKYVKNDLPCYRHNRGLFPL